MLKIFQTVRLLSRNPNIQPLLYQENILNFFESIVEKIMNNSKLSYGNQSEILDNLLIEIISIIKRYFMSIYYSNNKPINSQDNKIENFNNYNNSKQSTDKDNIQDKFLEKIINETNLFDQMIFLLNKENITILRLLHYILLSVIKK